jgi:hypothetical protein|tara:strand:+ start:1391 stop:1642 length:252 start_codon:yes stop_codon:yes gene_type:complete
MVPFGPRFDFITSCSPFAALMFMNSAAARDIISALGLTDFREFDAMVVGLVGFTKRFVPRSHGRLNVCRLQRAFALSRCQKKQ